MTRQLITSDEAPVSNLQHTHPCTDCPFARTALPGWLGDASTKEWLTYLHSDERIDCHAISGPQCAGASIYRANVGKIPRPLRGGPSPLCLPADKVLVFSSPGEFIRHHERLLGKTSSL